MREELVDYDRVCDHSDDLHLDAASRAEHRVDFQGLSKEPGPVPLRALGESVVGILDPCVTGEGAMAETLSARKRF